MALKDVALRQSILDHTREMRQVQGLEQLQARTGQLHFTFTHARAFGWSGSRSRQPRSCRAPHQPSHSLATWPH